MLLNTLRQILMAAYLKAPYYVIISVTIHRILQEISYWFVLVVNQFTSIKYFLHPLSFSNMSEF